MIPRIRLRRHTAGRVAVLGSNDHWVVVDGDATYGAQGEICVSGPGWSELFVAELPEPDGEVLAVGDDGEDWKTPLWRLSFGESVTAWLEGVETPVWELREDLGKIRSDALKMLAAAAASEQHRAERATT